MNIIEAWKQAKEGQTIRRSHFSNTLMSVKREKEVYRLHEQMGQMSAESILADDWEVIKEKKILHYTALSSQTLHFLKTDNNEVVGIQIFEDDKITIEREE